MEIESLITIVFSEDELKESLLAMLDASRNDLLYTDPKHEQLTKLIEHARSNSCSLDWIDGKFHMSIDGVHEVKKL